MNKVNIWVEQLSNDVTHVNNLIVNDKSEDAVKHIQMLIEKGIDVNTKINIDELGLTHKGRWKNWTFLLLAAHCGNNHTVKYLICKGANIEHQDEHKNTALIIGAAEGHLPVIEWLIKAGVKVNHQNRNGYSALAIAAKNGHLSLVKCLIGASADINQSGPSNSTPLFLAMEYNHRSVMDYLIMNGAKGDRYAKRRRYDEGFDRGFHWYRGCQLP